MITDLCRALRRLGALSLLLTVVACGGPEASVAPAPVAVTVANAQLSTATDAIELDGVVAPSATVDLVARVSGYLQAAPFEDGQQVRKGQLLFVIEPAVYREQVRINEAKVDQARAEARRQTGLLAENATSEASVETARSQLLQAEGNLELARLNLQYTQVRAPFDGVVGRRRVDVGNYVGATAGGTVLATVQRVRPAYVDFALNERDLLRLRPRATTGTADPRQPMGVVEASATLQGERQPSATGVLDFVGIGLDEATGTVPMRARFANATLHLVPGLYAKVRIDSGPPRQILTVPETALQADQQGSFVFVVDAQDTARRRRVVKGSQFGTQREISSGLKAGDRVVVDGLSSLAEGAKVKAKSAGPRVAVGAR